MVLMEKGEKKPNLEEPQTEQTQLNWTEVYPFQCV